MFLTLLPCYTIFVVLRTLVNATQMSYSQACNTHAHHVVSIRSVTRHVVSPGTETCHVVSIGSVTHVMLSV